MKKGKPRRIERFPAAYFRIRQPPQRHLHDLHELCHLHKCGICMSCAICKKA